MLGFNPMRLDYQIPPDRDPDREREPAQWKVLFIAMAIGVAVLLGMLYLRLHGKM